MRTWLTICTFNLSNHIMASDEFHTKIFTLPVVTWVSFWSSIIFIIHHTRIQNCWLDTRQARQKFCTLLSNICGSPTWNFFMLPFHCLESLDGSKIFGKFVYRCITQLHMKVKIYFNKFLKMSAHVDYLCILKNLLNCMLPSY
jgi:hypothetical protein